MTETVRALIDAPRDPESPALRSAEGEMCWADVLDGARCRAAVVDDLLRREAPSGLPRHVGALLENTPEMLLSLVAAGLGGHVAVGLNATRRGEGLARDVRLAECAVVLTDSAHRPLLDGLDLGGAVVVDTDAPEWAAASASADPVREIAEPGPDDLFGLVFTSGTSGAPKAVRVTHRAMAMSGELIAGTFGLTDADVVYLAMPLFHSNALMASFAPALASGATIAPRPRFSASEFLSDVRRYGVTYFGYVGKPLAYILDTPVEDDDADNPLRLAFGNEASPADVAAFSERFGCMVLDGYGSTELAVTIRRDAETPPQSIGKAFPGIAILDPETGEECPPARFDADGTVLDLDACVGEIVNTGGAGLFGGYHRDPEATAERMRDGMYWSGDLAYADEQGNVYLVGRSGDWVRVDGENMACGIVEAILLRDPALAQAVVYGVPDPRGVGDQLVAALVPRAGSALVPRDLEEFLAAQPDLSTKAWPRWVRVCRSLPTTATNKVLKRELAAHGVAPAGGPDEWWERDERGRGYSPMA